MRRQLAILCLSALAAFAGCADDSGAPRVADDVKTDGAPAAPAGPTKSVTKAGRPISTSPPATAGGAKVKD